MTYCMAHSESLTPNKLLHLFDEAPNHYSKPLLSSNPDVVFSPPPLLPGETLLLQQDNVSCIDTLNSVANGVLHLTNYRIIFSGSYTQDPTLNGDGNADPEILARQGYRYQTRKYQFPMDKVNQLRKFHSKIGKSVKKGGRTIGNSIKKSRDRILYQLYSLQEDENAINDVDKGCVITVVRPILERSLSEQSGRMAQADQVCLSIPNLSVCMIQKFPKQYLEKEKLMMLRDGIEIICTNFQTFKFGLGGSSAFDADELVRKLVRHALVKSLIKTFAVRYAENLHIPTQCGNILQDTNAPNFYTLERECSRLHITGVSEYKVKDQSVCNSYLSSVILPMRFKCSSLKKLAESHSNGCFPAVTWRHKSGNVLLRSSVPVFQRGSADCRCQEDELLMDEVCRNTAVSNEVKLKIFFSSKQKQTAINSNISSSGGLRVEEGKRYYYPYCMHIIVEDIPECQAVQGSCAKLSNALRHKVDDSRFLSTLEDTGWLLQIQVILQTATSVAMALEAEKVSALISFSTGTDQTSQVSSLAQLMVDPYYRTLDGFQVLIQKEWIAFKHRFIKRNILTLSSEEDIAPIFLQFLDCVWQLMQQFPTYFQFNDYFLESLANHAYAGRFGTFFDVEKSCGERYISYWTWVNVNVMAQDDFTNPIYDEDEGERPIFPETGMEWLEIWTWHKNCQSEENLVQALEIKMMQTEKLQREYKETLEKYLKLMKQISEQDEEYPLSFNTRSAADFCDGPTNSFSSSYASDSDTSSVASRDRYSSYFENLKAVFGKKAKSFNDLLAFQEENDDSVRHGHSTFYDVKSHKKSGSLGRKISTLPSSFEIEEKFTSLKDYLEQRGINTKGVHDVQVSAKSCSGYLTKQGKLHKSWKKRWFVLDLNKRCVAYFNDPTKEPKRVFSYVSIRDVCPHPDQHKNPNFFYLHTFERTFYIQAPGHQSMDIWIACLSVPLTALLPG